MRFHPRIIIAVLCLCACGAFFASAARAQTIDEVIAKHTEARGGAEKLGAMKSFRQSGQLDLGGGQIATLVQEQKRPNMMRMELIMSGKPTAIRAYDGKSGWVFMPQTGKTNPEPADAATLKDLTEESDFAG